MANTVRKDTRVLQRLIRETPDKADALLRGAATEMVGEIALITPVDTGELRASLHWEADGALRILIMDGVEHGIYQELGTETMPAQPFVGPVFERWRQGEFMRFARDFGVFE